MASEKTVRDYLRDQCKILGWECLPLIDLSKRGWTDRTIIGFGGRVAFAEVKQDGYHHDPAHLTRQAKRRKRLQDMGHIAVQIVGKVGVDKFLDFLLQQLEWPVIESAVSEGMKDTLVKLGG